MRVIGITGLILITQVILSACNDDRDTTDYFPLDKGLEWQYKQLLTTEGKQEEWSYTVTNLDTTEIDNQEVTVRRTNDGRDYYLIRKPDGIYRYASRTLFETYPTVDEPSRKILPLPYLDSSTKQWSSTTTRYIIHRIGPSTIVSANSDIQNFVMSYRITSQDETVIVPAGKFEDCILVEGDATLTLFTDPHIGYQDIPIKTREWYAPGIGLVKLERTEPVDTRVYKGGSYIFELTHFSD